MEQTLFEKIGVTYREQNGYLYPILPADDAEVNLDVGKYGRMWLHILFETNRRDYNRRLWNGTLIDDAVRKNERAYEIIDFITKRELQKLSDEQKHSSMAMYKCRMAARVTAEEKFLADIMQKLRTEKSILSHKDVLNTQQEESEE